MTKICLLKAEILRMHLAFKDLTELAMQSILKNLRMWYKQLPDVMRMDAIGRESLALETRRSILHLHLLYLGAIMLLYRRVVSQFLRSRYTGRKRDILPMPIEGLLLDHSIEAVLAASTSSKILKLLLEDNSIFKRCWIVM